MRILIIFICLLCSSSLFALGNHPQASNCTPEKPYQAICTHSLHSLEGWYGHCHAQESDAQKDADEHANQHHDGNSRWTGIKKARFSGAAGY
jgi:hypothetical protein